MRSKHYFREKGAKAEKVIHALSTKTFFADWCYLNPPRPDGKELCDLLVVFDDTAIIWQIKDLKVDSNGQYKQAEVEKNLSQLSGARRRLFELQTPITLKNPRRGNEAFDPKRIKTIHLISVLMGDGEGPLPLMDTIKQHKVHVFTREFADIALRELDTISDFCRYLKAKEAIENTAITIIGGEKNLLGKYIYEGRSFDWLKNADRVFIDDSIWPAIQAKPEVIKKRELDKISYGWDSIIDRAHEGSLQYEKVARELARPDRFTRRMLSKSFSEAYAELVASDNEMMRRYSPVGDTTYCFLIVNDDEHPSKRRQLMLQHMCFVARSLPPKNSRVVGVATGRGNRSYDFLFLDMPIWGPREEELKNQIQRQYGIFVSPRITIDPEDEYPLAEGK